MSKKSFWLSLPLCMVIALLAAFLFVSPAFAQDETPPEVVPAETPVEVLPTEAVPTEATEAVPAEVLPTEAAPAEAAPVEEAPAAEPSLAEALDEAGVALAGASGTPVTLVARSTGILASTGDPYFTVGSTTYQFLNSTTYGSCGTNCWYSPTPIRDALQYMIDNVLTPTDRILHIQEDPNPYKETVEVWGGDPGVKGLTGIKGEGDPTKIVINGNLYIGGFPSGFSVSNLTVYNPDSVDDAAIWTYQNGGTLKLTDVTAQAEGEDSSGIIISHSGTVELNRVDSSNNAYLGAYIENYTTGAIKITNSTFENNQKNVFDGNWYFDCTEWDGDGYCTKTRPHKVGLEIGWNGGPVTLFGVSASGNVGDGAEIIAYNSAITVKDSVFDNNSYYELEYLPGDYYSWGDGLFIDSNTVSLENIQANNNGMRGIFSYANTSFTSKHTHTDGNAWSGVQVFSCFDWGDADSMCDNPGAGTVTLTNASSSYNGGDGVSVYSKGAVTVSSFFLGGNEESGIHVDNTDSPSAPAVTITDVEVSGGAINELDEWYKATNNGIALNIKGIATLKDINVHENANDGLHIESIGTGAVTVTNASNMFNESWGNDEFGYQIVTKGPVTVTNFDVHDNGLLGGSIDNSGAASAAAVTVNVIGGPEYFNGYQRNGTGGLYIKSRGVVTVSRVMNTDNLGVGLEINNFPALLTAPGVAVTVSDSYFDNNYVVDLNSDEDGLKILSKGLVTLANIRANGNDGFGATIDNFYAGSTAGVTINAATGKGNEFQWNQNGGLKIRTNGAVTITNVFANDNGDDLLPSDYGVEIQNNYGTGAVTIKQVGGWSVQNSWAEGNVFSNNHEGGLYIQTNGVVSVAFFQARGNQDTGIYISASGGKGAVTLTGTSNYWESLNDNGADGLHIDAQGNITVSKIRAGGNGNNGASLYNNLGAGNVTLTDAYFDWNGNYGLDLNTNGTVSWKNGFASENFYYGAYIQDLGVGKAVTITNVSASGNGETGIFVESKGAVTMTESEGNNNSANYYVIDYGQWWTDNLNDDQVWYFNGALNDDVTIELSSSRFNPYIWIIDPERNYVDDVGGTDGSLSYNFTLPLSGLYEIHIGSDPNDCGNCWAYDLKLYTDIVPAPSDPNFFSSANGVYVDNHQGTGAVTISNASNRWFGNNSATAVVVVSSGAVSLKGMDMNDSGQGGAWINNIPSTGTGAPGVTLTSVNFYNNDLASASITTRGPVTVKTSDQSGNKSYGFWVDNTDGSALSPITFTDVGLHNWGTTETGVYLHSDGAVTLTNVTSNGNVGAGFDIDAAGAVKFTLVSGYGNDGYGAHVVTDSTFTVVGSTTNTTSFAYNSGTGLYVQAGGAISLTKVSAGDNGWRDEITGDPTTYGNGIYLTSTNTLGTAPITLSDVTSYHNTEDGLYISTNGAVTVNTLKVENNTEYGLYLDQTGAPDSLKAITLNLVTANYNGKDGMYVNGKGSITTNTIWALINGGSGAVLLNNNGTSTGSVTMLNTLGYKTNVMVGNSESGVFISSYGAVTINQLESSNNILDGLDVTNKSSAAIKPAVTLNNVITRYNFVGMDVQSTGVVTINTSWATNNAHDGIAVHVNNNVNILNTASTMNGWSGIWADNSSGTWTLKLTGSAWFGNNRASLGYANLAKTGNWALVY